MMHMRSNPSRTAPKSTSGGGGQFGSGMEALWKYTQGSTNFVKKFSSKLKPQYSSSGSLTKEQEEEIYYRNDDFTNILEKHVKSFFVDVTVAAVHHDNGTGLRDENIDNFTKRYEEMIYEIKRDIAEKIATMPYSINTKPEHAELVLKKYEKKLNKLFEEQLKKIYLTAMPVDKTNNESLLIAAFKTGNINFLTKFVNQLGKVPLDYDHFINRFKELQAKSGDKLYKSGEMKNIIKMLELLRSTVNKRIRLEKETRVKGSVLPLLATMRVTTQRQQEPKKVGFVLVDSQGGIVDHGTTGIPELNQTDTKLTPIICDLSGGFNPKKCTDGQGTQMMRDSTFKTVIEANGVRLDVYYFTDTPPVTPPGVELKVGVETTATIARNTKPFKQYDKIMKKAEILAHGTKRYPTQQQVMLISALKAGQQLLSGLRAGKDRKRVAPQWLHGCAYSFGKSDINVYLDFQDILHRASLGEIDQILYTLEDILKEPVISPKKKPIIMQEIIKAMYLIMELAKKRPNFTPTDLDPAKRMKKFCDDMLETIYPGRGVEVKAAREKLYTEMNSLITNLVMQKHDETFLRSEVAKLPRFPLCTLPHSQLEPNLYLGSTEANGQMAVPETGAKTVLLEGHGYDALQISHRGQFTEPALIDIHGPEYIHYEISGTPQGGQKHAVCYEFDAVTPQKFPRALAVIVDHVFKQTMTGQFDRVIESARPKKLADTGRSMAVSVDKPDSRMAVSASDSERVAAVVVDADKALFEDADKAMSVSAETDGEVRERENKEREATASAAKIQGSMAPGSRQSAARTTPGAMMADIRTHGTMEVDRERELKEREIVPHVSHVSTDIDEEDADLLDEAELMKQFLNINGGFIPSDLTNSKKTLDELYNIVHALYAQVKDLQESFDEPELGLDEQNMPLAQVKKLIRQRKERLTEGGLGSLESQTSEKENQLLKLLLVIYDLRLNFTTYQTEDREALIKDLAELKQENENYLAVSTLASLKFDTGASSLSLDPSHVGIPGFADPHRAAAERADSTMVGDDAHDTVADDLIAAGGLETSVKRAASISSSAATGPGMGTASAPRGTYVPTERKDQAESESIAMPQGNADVDDDCSMQQHLFAEIQQRNRTKEQDRKRDSDMVRNTDSHSDRDKDEDRKSGTEEHMVLVENAGMEGSAVPVGGLGVTVGDAERLAAQRLLNLRAVEPELHAVHEEAPNAMLLGDDNPATESAHTAAAEGIATATEDYDAETERKEQYDDVEMEAETEQSTANITVAPSLSPLSSQFQQPDSSANGSQSHSPSHGTDAAMDFSVFSTYGSASVTSSSSSVSAGPGSFSQSPISTTGRSSASRTVPAALPTGPGDPASRAMLPHYTVTQARASQKRPAVSNPKKGSDPLDSGKKQKRR